MANVPWLRDIPAYWGVVRSKRLFAERKERARPNDQQLSATQAYGVIRQEEFERRVGRRVVAITQHLDKRAHVERDDFVISMRSFEGGLERAWAAGAIRSSYVVLKPLPEVNVGYFAHLFKSHDYIGALQATSNFIRDGQDLSMRNFSLVDLPLPPKQEQDAIAAFLDRKLEEIDRFIAAKKRMIELLEEQKAAMIDRAVTKGLNPDAKMKPSGLAWLGEIPEHWGLRKAKQLGGIKYGLGQPPATVPGGLPLIRATNIDCGNILREGMVYVDSTLLPPQRDPILRTGDIIVVRSGALTGDSAVVPPEYDGAVAGYDMVYRVSAADPRLVGYALLSKYVRRDQLALSMLRAAQPHLNAHELGECLIAVPPQREQLGITSYLDCQCNAADRATESARSEIRLMAEYRTTLISDAVTGKVSVTVSAPVVAAPAAAESRTEPKLPRRANIHFQRAVFATEIIHRLHQEPTFGHVKCEKLIFLCEKRCRVETGSTYRRKAAGPYDNFALRSIDHQLKRNDWYAARKVGERYQYVPLAKAGGHQKYFLRYFNMVEAEFSRVIEMFRSFDTVRCEIVATLYSAWEDLLADGKEATDDQIIEQVLEHWHPSKQNIPEDRWRKAIGWMKEQGFVPGARSTG